MSETTAPRYSFTQPLCAACWDIRNPDRPAHHVSDENGPGEREECCDCGRATYGGIYIRVDPTTVSHPTILKD